MQLIYKRSVSTLLRQEVDIEADTYSVVFIVHWAGAVS